MEEKKIAKLYKESGFWFEEFAQNQRWGCQEQRQSPQPEKLYDVGFCPAGLWGLHTALSRGPALSQDIQAKLPSLSPQDGISYCAVVES